MCDNCICSFQVSKLEAVGYKPILFIGKPNKRASNKCVADIITHLHPTPVTKTLLDKMRRAYEFILTKSTSSAQQPEGQAAAEGQVAAEGQMVAESQAAAIQTKESQTIFVLNLVPLSSPLSPTSLSPTSSSTCTTILPSLSSPLSLPCSESLRQIKRTNTSTSSHYSPCVSPPSLSASSISTSLSQEGPRVKNRRKGCRKCSRQKVFQFDQITGERINEVKCVLLGCLLF
ncbi:uncharacterized protein LOC127654290 [Xyrauchen texanus]|uniref:uncharacterized protein LOC127654290 n=1 Tax=Xyrauchen texanus TaxID=154827 RepID=UPI0022427B0A|nr:uncharacterized protein LOC127654290 [Xyrauchen texanus]